MADDDPIVRAMAAVTLAYNILLFSAGLKYVLVDVTKDYYTSKLRMKFDLEGYGLWP